MDIIQKTRDDYNKIAHHFSATRYDLWPELEQFKVFIKDGQQILDWGCGHGRLLLLLKDKNVKYFGVDQSKNLLKLAAKKYQEEIKIKKASFFCTAFKNKIFPDNFFDVAFMIASFFHLPDQKSRLKLFKKTYRELKPGGKLIISVWNLGSDWAKQKGKKDWKKLGPHDFLIPWKNQAGKIEAERYYHHFTKEEMKELLDKVGYKIEKMEYYNKDIRSDSMGGRNLIVIATK